MDDYRNELFSENINLTYWIINKYFPAYKGDEDLKQACLLSLWNACLRFDESKGYKFATFAGRCISNGALMFLRDKKKENRIQYVDNTTMVNGEEIDIFDSIADKPTGEVSLNFYVKELFPKLNKLEKTILIMRLKGFNQVEISQKISMSQPYVSRVLEKIKKKI